VHRPAARERSGTARLKLSARRRLPELTSEHRPSIPHARAAGPPTGRSFSCFCPHSPRTAFNCPEINALSRLTNVHGRQDSRSPSIFGNLSKSGRESTNGRHATQGRSEMKKGAGQTLRPQILDSPAGRLTAVRLLPLRDNEKGGWCKPPSSRTDPPKPESQSRLGSGHPGKPILYFSWPYIMQTVCQRSAETHKPRKPL
jgi:hypothetical protein